MAPIKKNQSDIWQMSVNPTRNLSRRESEQIVDSARRGNEVRLQTIYAEIEKSFPVLSMVVDRRSSALLERDWKIGIIDAKRILGFDEELAKKQAEYLEAIYGEAQFNGLYDALGHLALAFFRGYSSVGFEQNKDGTIKAFTLYNNIHFVREPYTKNLYWNPSASEMVDFKSPDVTLIPEDENIVVQVERPVDTPLIHLYLMYAMGKTKYGQFIEKFGIPPIILVAPETVTDEKIGEFTARAQQIFQGGSGVIGAGTTVTAPASNFRGQDPFTPYLNYIDEQVVLLATGSTLGSLTSPTGMGSGVAESQENTFNSIITRDALTVANAINKTLTKKLLNDKFPGSKHLAYFDFNFDKPANATDVLDLAVKAKNAGFIMDSGELSEKTGYTIVGSTIASTEPKVEPTITAINPKSESITLDSDFRIN